MAPLSYEILILKYYTDIKYVFQSWLLRNYPRSLPGKILFSSIITAKMHYYLAKKKCIIGLSCSLTYSIIINKIYDTLEEATECYKIRH